MRAGCASRGPPCNLGGSPFGALRTSGLEKAAPRPGRIPPIGDHQRPAIGEATLHSQPPNATYWKTRTVARAQGVSQATVRRIWRQHGLRLHRLSTFKVSRDAQRVQKLTDVVVLYLNPPDKALVLSVEGRGSALPADGRGTLLGYARTAFAWGYDLPLGRDRERSRRPFAVTRRPAPDNLTTGTAPQRIQQMPHF